MFALCEITNFRLKTMIVPISRKKREQCWADRENEQEISLKVIAWQEQQGQQGQNASM